MAQLQSPLTHTARRVRTPVPHAVDVAIIGCGLGGLQAGALLTAAGVRVALFDGHYVAGGCATMFERGRSEARYRFDVGLHYIGDCGPTGQIPRLLARSGVQLQYAALDPDGFDTLVLPDFRFRIPVGHEAYRQRLINMFPQEKKGIDRYVSFLLEVDRVQRGMEKSGGKMTVRSVMQLLVHGRQVARFKDATVSQLLDTCTQDPQLRAVMLGQSGDYGVAPSQASAVLHAGLANHYFQGAYYPVGGGQVIADRLSERIEAGGGTIHLRKAVTRIRVQGRAVAGVELDDGQLVQAAKVVSNADIKRTLLELIGPAQLPGEWLTRARSWQMGGALSLTCVGVAKDLRKDGLTASNYWQFDSYDVDSFYRSQGVDGHPDPRGCYVTSACMKDPETQGHAPDGVIGMEIMALVPASPEAWGVTAEEVASGHYRKNPEYMARKQRLEDNMLARLEHLFAGSREAVVFKETATPLSHSRFTGASDGTGYGLAAIPSQFMQHRPGYRGPLQGLYFAGASTRAGHGIVGALTGGTRAAERVALDLARTLAAP